MLDRVYALENRTYHIEFVHISRPRFSREYPPIPWRTPRVLERTARFRPPGRLTAVWATRFARSKPYRIPSCSRRSRAGTALSALADGIRSCASATRFAGVFQSFRHFRGSDQRPADTPTHGWDVPLRPVKATEYGVPRSEPDAGDTGQSADGPDQPSKPPTQRCSIFTCTAANDSNRGGTPIAASATSEPTKPVGQAEFQVGKSLRWRDIRRTVSACRY